MTDVVTLVSEDSSYSGSEICFRDQ